MSKEDTLLELEVIPEEQRNQYVLQLYKSKIDYYWNASRANKNGYRYTRYLIIILGSLVTLITSLTASRVIETMGLEHFLQILAPVLAACLTILGGFSQNFHWGLAWREMVLTVMELERVYHKLKITPEDERDPVSEIELLHKLMLTEGKNFFDRLVGVSSKEDMQKLEAMTSVKSEENETRVSSENG
jgi:hypothetical protein